MNSPTPTSSVHPSSHYGDRTSRDRWTRRLARTLALLGALLLAIGFVTGRLTARSDKSPTPTSPATQNRGSQATAIDGSQDTPRSNDSSLSFDADPRAADAAAAVDAAAPTYESPLIRALSAVVEQNDQVFGDATDPIEQSLMEGDRILSEAKSSNRAAIRQANRQVRLPGRSPHVLVLLVDGLTTADLGCYATAHNSTTKTPHLDAFAQSGVRLTHFAEARTSVAKSRATSVDSFRSSRTPQVFWDSGYSTCLLGDCSHAWANSESWDHVFGWKSPLADRLPKTVISNGRTLRIAGRTDGTNVRFDDLLIDEIVSLISAGAGRRPVAIFVNVSRDWWHTGASDGTDDDARTEWDRFFGRIVRTLDATAGKGRTIIVVVGTPRPIVDEKLELSESGVPLLLAWPDHIPAGNVIDRPADFDDLLPTLARLIGSTRAK